MDGRRNVPIHYLRLLAGYIQSIPLPFPEKKVNESQPVNWSKQEHWSTHKLIKNLDGFLIYIIKKKKM